MGSLQQVELLVVAAEEQEVWAASAVAAANERMGELSEAAWATGPGVSS